MFQILVRRHLVLSLSFLRQELRVVSLGGPQRDVVDPQHQELVLDGVGLRNQ